MERNKEASQGIIDASRNGVSVLLATIKWRCVRLRVVAVSSYLISVSVTETLTGIIRVIWLCRCGKSTMNCEFLAANEINLLAICKGTINGRIRWRSKIAIMLVLFFY